MDDLVGQQFLVVDDRAEMIVPEHVDRGEDPDNTRDSPRGIDIDRLHPAVGDRAADEVDAQLAEERRQVVEIDRLAADVLAGRIVRQWSAEASH